MGEMGLVLAWVCMVMLRYEHVVMSDLHGAGEQRLEWPRQSILYHDFQVVSWRAVILPMCISILLEHELRYTIILRHLLHSSFLSPLVNRNLH
jgi:hypothetical protein